MRSLLDDAPAHRHGSVALVKIADVAANAYMKARTLPTTAATPIRQAMTAGKRTAVHGARTVAHTVGGGLAAMQAIDSVPRIAGKASQDYHNILGAYYQHGGK